MTLRLRLVLALVALVAVGLAVFGIATYAAYSRSQHQRLDEQLRNSIGFMTGKLYEQRYAGEDGGDPTATGPGPDQGGDRPPGPPLVVPSGTYAELRDPDGTVVASIQLSDPTGQPDLPPDLTPPAQGRRWLTTGSVSGSGRWRVSEAW